MHSSGRGSTGVLSAADWEEEAFYFWGTVFDVFTIFGFKNGDKDFVKRRVNIACVQEPRWVGSRAKDTDGYKLLYSGVQKGKNGVGILVDRELRESVIEVRRVNDRLMIIKLVVGECTLNVVSAYAPHAGLDEEVKQRFWEGLDEIVCKVLPAKKLFI
ncbi:uncharacterized protein [Nicotiana tomentosiformis]|uniref:uncharacterized protein n=1 Tax=Nicotiana tomentosiformis TaxID=4098 RepID=UPI00388C40AF